MTAAHDNATETPPEAAPGPIPAEAATTPPGNPALIGVPTFLVGSIALGLVLVGYTSASGASIPIIMTATGIGQVISAIWASRIGADAVASVFGIFSGFWISYAALVLGLTHNWFGIATAADALAAQKLFLLSWLLLIGLLTLATLRLPLAFTVLFVLIEAALLFVFLGTSQGSVGLLHTGGWLVFAFIIVGAYLFVDAMNTATGGKPLPMGTPVLH